MSETGNVSRTAGIANPDQLPPGNVHGMISTSGMMMVNTYKITACTSQERSPNVMKFMGMSKILIMGATNVDKIVKTRPIKRSGCQPFGRMIVGRIWLASQMLNVLKKYVRSKFLMWR